MVDWLCKCKYSRAVLDGGESVTKKKPFYFNRFQLSKKNEEVPYEDEINRASSNAGLYIQHPGTGTGTPVLSSIISPGPFYPQPNYNPYTRVGTSTGGRSSP